MKKMFERFNKRNLIFAWSILAVIAIVIVASGGWTVAGGLALAMAVPALTDEETEFLTQVKNSIRSEVEKYDKNYVSKTHLEEFVTQKMNDARINEMVSKEEYDKLKNDLEEMGLKIKSMSEGAKEEKKYGTLGKFFKDIADKFDRNNKQHNSNTIIKAAALMTTANIIPETADGFSPLFGNYIDTEVGHVPKPDPVILPLVSVTTQPGTEKIYYTDRVNEDGDAAFIGEGTLKPLADADYQTSSAPIEEVAVRWKFTKRLMNHAPSIVGDFMEHAEELIDQKIDDNLIAGGGVSPNLSGLEDLASAFVCPTGLVDYYPLDGSNIYDQIMALATTVRLANFKGSLTCILNTVWQAKMAGIKDVNGQYVIPPFVSPDGKMVGEVRIVFSNKVDEANIILGDLSKFKVVFSEDVEYDEGYENDDFSKNLVSRKLEAFLGTYMKQSDAGSIIADAIATVKTAIEAAV